MEEGHGAIGWFMIVVDLLTNTNIPRKYEQTADDANGARVCCRDAERNASATNALTKRISNRGCSGR